MHIFHTQIFFSKPCFLEEGIIQASLTPSLHPGDGWFFANSYLRFCPPFLQTTNPPNPSSATRTTTGLFRHTARHGEFTVKLIAK